MNVKWKERLSQMSDNDKKYLITGIEDGWIDPSDDDLHIYNKLKGIDDHPILNWIINLFKRRDKNKYFKEG